MWRVIFDVVLLAADTWAGVDSLKRGRYKWASADFWLAGWFFCRVLWDAERGLLS